MNKERSQEIIDSVSRNEAPLMTEDECNEITWIRLCLGNYKVVVFKKLQK